MILWLHVFDHTNCVFFWTVTSDYSCIVPWSIKQAWVLSNIIAHTVLQLNTWIRGCPLIGPRMKGTFRTNLLFWSRRLDSWWWYKVESSHHHRSVPYILLYYDLSLFLRFDYTSETWSHGSHWTMLTHSNINRFYRYWFECRDAVWVT